MDGHVDANGVHIWYETVGQGDPVLFLHGGIVSSVDYAAQRDGLAKKHRVVMADRRGHGRTPEVAGPISYDLMVDDTVAFMNAIGLERAHVVGHSDGAIIGLLLAIAHPDRVNRLVPISANTRPDAMAIADRDWMSNSTDEEFAAVVASFTRTMPGWPARSDAFFRRMRRLFLTQPDITPADLGRIRSPTLIIGADRDSTSIEDLVLQFRSIPGAQLAIVPGATHFLTGEQPDVVNDLILRFLDSPLPGPGDAR